MAVSKKQREMEEARKRLEREKASGKTSKKSTVLTKNKDTVDSYQQDRPERLAAKIGSPRLEDAPITYENKKFNKRKKTKDGGKFEWQGKMLKDLSNKKYGKSYAAKFDSLANEAGIPKSQRGAFKDYLDSQEYPANATASYDNAKFENDRRVDKLKKKNQAEKAQVQKQEEAVKKQAQKVKETPKNTNILQDMLDLGKGAAKSIPSFFTGDFGDQLIKNASEKDRKSSDSFEGVQRFANRTGNSALLGLPAQAEKAVTGEQSPFQTKREIGEGGGTDIIADMLGYLAPGVGVAKGIRGTKLGAQGLTKGITKRNVGQLAKEGASVGAIMSGTEVAGREALNPEDYNWKQNAGQIALETGAGAALDPVISLLGPLLKAGADRSMNDVVNSTNQDLLTRMMQGVGKMDEMPSPLDVGTGQNQLERLLGQAQRSQVQAPRLDVPDTRAQGDQALADYTRQYQEAQSLAAQTRQARTNPEGLTDYEPNFTMRDNNQLKLEAPRQENYPTVYRPDAPLEEKMAYWKNPEMARTDTDVREIVKEMENIESNIQQFNDNLPQLRSVEIQRDPTIKSIYDRSNELLEESNRADSLWTAAKQIQDQFKVPKNRPEWAQFSVDSQLRNSDEFKAIPRRFVKNGHGTDFAKAMDLAGFDNEVDFIKHLQFIDSQLKIGPRKSLSTLGTKESKDVANQLESFENQFENDLREQFGIGDMERQLDELSELATPYDPPTESPLAFRTTQRNEVPRDPITEILYPNNQYGVERGTPNSPRSEVAVTSNEAPVRAESLNIEQSPTTSTMEPKMVRVKQQENLQQQAMDVVTSQPRVITELISKGTPESDMYAKRIIEATTKNPILKAVRKYRQGLVSSKSGANYAEKHLLKQNQAKLEGQIKNAIDPSEKTRLQEELELNNRYLKATKDTGSLMQAIENEIGSDVKAMNMANKFVSKLTRIPDTTLSEATNWQLAKRLDWLSKGDESLGVPARSLPDSWLKWSESVLANDKPAFRESEQAFRELQESRLDNLLKSGQKSQEEIEKLLREPYYVPAYLDDSYKVAKGVESGKAVKGMPNGQRSTTSDITTIKSFGSEDSAGNPTLFVNNPIESVIGDLFREQRSIARNDIAQEMNRLSQIDDLGTFVKKVDQKTFELNGGKENNAYLKGYENGEPFYLQIHGDFRKMLAENDAIDIPNKIQIATTLMSRLKTTSVEYLATSIPRELATGFMNSETKNPFKYADRVWKALTDESHKQVGKDAGVEFRNAYDPHSASQQSAGQLQKEIQAKLVVDGEKDSIRAYDLIGKAFNVLTKPQRALGQISDDVPRIVEANLVKERWEKNILSKTRAEIEQVTQALETAPKGDFEEGNVLQLQGQLESLQARLLNEQRGMEREMTHRGRDVMPYQRSGESFIAKDVFKRYLNFANTTTQAKDKMLRSFSRDPLGTTMKGVGLAAPFTVGISMMYDGLSDEDKEHYDAIPDYAKQQRYIVPLGDKKYISIPKVQELAILSNMADAEAGLMSYEAAKTYAIKEITPLQLGGVTSAIAKESDDPRTATEFLGDVTFPSNILSPVFDISSNKKTTFNGKPISYNREGTPDEWTKDIFKAMFGGSDAANFAQYGTQQYGGDLGKYGSAIANMLYNPSSGNITEGSRDLNPLQDYFFKENSPLFKEMFYDKDKLKK